VTKSQMVGGEEKQCIYVDGVLTDQLIAQHAKKKEKP